MPRKQKTIHYLYKTTCLVTGRYYIGMHSTSNLEDGYLGSGKVIRRSIRKYGPENHKKEILEFFESRELLIEAEKMVITPEMVVDKMCMNLIHGGIGWMLSHNKAFSEKLKLDEEFRLDFSNKISNARKRELKFNLRPNFNCDWTGKKHLESTIIKMREKKLGTGVKEANSKYGTCWITNGVENKKINLVDLDNYSNSEWFRGRT